MSNDAEHKVYQLAGTQAGYITTQQALACGMSPDAINRRARSKRWNRAKLGLYLIPGFAPSWRGLLSAATAALKAVVSHESAAEIHNLPWVERRKAVVTVPTRTTNRFPDVIVHQSTDLSADQIVVIDGLPVTNAVRTVIDLAATRRPHIVGRLVDHLVVTKMATIDEIEDSVRDLSRRGKPGMKTMKVVLDPRIGENFLGDSHLELLGLRFFEQWGFPRPECQYPLPWRSFCRGRVDFAFPTIKLIIELDGRRWHSTLDSFEDDRLRDNNAQLAGWRVLRITYRMLMEQPETVRRMIEAAMAA